MTPETAQSILTSGYSPWVLVLNPTVTEITTDQTTLTMPVTPDILRIGDIVCGQALTAIAGTAMVFDCFGHLDAPEPVGTVTPDTQLLRSATGTLVWAQAQVARAGDG